MSGEWLPTDSGEFVASDEVFKFGVSQFSGKWDLSVSVRDGEYKVGPFDSKSLALEFARRHLGEVAKLPVADLPRLDCLAS
jgi:hypothetical protein